MAVEIKKDIQLEIAHVLFTDIVGYSKLPIHQQDAKIERVNDKMEVNKSVSQTVLNNQ